MPAWRGQNPGIRALGGPQARELPLAELQHAAVEPGSRDVQRLRRQPLAIELHAALRELAPRLRARDPEGSGDQLREMHDAAVGRERELRDVVRDLARDEHVIEARL